MMHLKMLAAAAAVAGGLGLSAAASAAPLAPVTAVAGAARVTDIAFGCGPGFTRGPFGRCHPIYGRPRFYGRRCFVRPTPFGPRRVCR